MPHLITKLRQWWLKLWKLPNVIQMQQTQDVEGLLAALKHANPKIRWAAMQALGKIWNIPALIKLGHHNPEVRCLAATTLGRLHDPRIVQPLIVSLKDPYKKFADDVAWDIFPVRRSAIKALDMIGDTGAIEPMVDMIRTWPEYPFPPPDEERLIQKCFLRMGEVAFNCLLILQHDQELGMRQFADFALREFDYARVRELVEKFENFDKQLLMNVSPIQPIYLIKNLGGVKQPIPVLVREPAEADGTILLDYTLILSHIGHERIIPTLVRALQEAEPVWRQVMIEYITNNGTTEAKAALGGYQQQIKT
jgi:hypothetical protein